MATIKSLESKLLYPARVLLDRAVEGVPSEEKQEFKYQILEATSAILSGFSFDWYAETVTKSPQTYSQATSIAKKLIKALDQSGIHPTLALASLSSPEIDLHERRQQGAYYTDFRLAHYCGDCLAGLTYKNQTIIDPASGSGALLAAAIIGIAGSNKKLAAKIIAESIYASDLDPLAIRAAKLTLSSLTSDTSAIQSMLPKLKVADSLMSGADLWPTQKKEGFDVVITNPPWDRLKLTFHEYLIANGHNRHYGHVYDNKKQHKKYAQEKEKLGQYISKIKENYSLIGGMETDTYALFLELSLKLLKKGTGQLVAIVPGGIIRSQGTHPIRHHLFERCPDLNLSIFDNRNNYFAIDTRFKFVILNGTKKNGVKRHPEKLRIFHPTADNITIAPGTPVITTVKEVSELRPDLTVPEVTSPAEWKLFKRISKTYKAMGDNPNWAHKFHREIDMSKFRNEFSKNKTSSSIPVIEGRMVHQYTSNAKSYISGTGRRAVWESNSNNTLLSPQFWLKLSQLPKSIKQHHMHPRIGFCDISGQTNERTMLATFIPPGVVCGNKVPTITFYEDNETYKKSLAWIALANSFVFDWLLRRVVTTTVNFFILDSIPLPDLSLDSLHTTRLAKLAEKALDIRHQLDQWEEYVRIRSEIDSIAFKLYECSIKEAQLILEDFHLLDRSSCPLPREDRSTITADTALLRFSKLSDTPDKQLEKELMSRIRRAKAAGSLAYCPTGLEFDTDLEEYASQSA